MSTFIMATKSGPPNLLVELGNPLSKDPVLYAGLFQAIFMLTRELTESPLKTVQAQGLTIKFHSINDHLLIAGTNKNIVSLDSFLDKCEQIIRDKMPIESHAEELELALRRKAELFLKQTGSSDKAHISQELKWAFNKIDRKPLKSLVWALLGGHHVHAPSTSSLDLNRSIEIISDYFGRPVCTSECVDCMDPIIFIEEIGDFVLNQTNRLLSPSKLPNTNILKKILKHIANEEYEDAKLILMSAKETFESIDRTVSGYTDLSEKDKNELDVLRFSLGADMEHHLVEYLKSHQNPYLNEFLSRVENIEWNLPW